MTLRQDSHLRWDFAEIDIYVFNSLHASSAHIKIKVYAPS
jgi:hypothetical protein